MQDPTREEMLEFLTSPEFAEYDEFDKEEAIYWFAYSYHSGQWSNLYSVLSTSPYKPSPLDRDAYGADLLDKLIDHYQGRV